MLTACGGPSYTSVDVRAREVAGGGTRAGARERLVSASARQNRVWLALGALGIAVWTWLRWAGGADLPLVGWDTFPLIAAGRVGSAGDVLGTFAEELMGGRYPLGSYWRPLVHLSFGLDHALGGLDPATFHRTDLALAILGALLAAEAARRWLAGGAHATWAALAAGLVYGTNLVHADIVDVPARRADSLAVVFTLFALCCALSRARPARWIAAVAVAAALASKESGAIAVVVVTGVHFVGASGAFAERWRAATRGAWPAWVAFALTFALRTWALGGIGGSREAQVSAAWSESFGAFVRYFPAAFAPAPARLLGSATISSGVALALVVVLAVAARREFLKSFGPLALWFVALAALTAISRAERGWYELPFVAINALFVAALVSRTLNSAGFLRVLALPAAAWVALSLFPWPTRTPTFLEASSAARDYLARLESTVRAARPGTASRLPGLPMEVRDPAPWLDGRPRTYALLAPYSISAFAELAWPARNLRIVPPAQPTPPRPDEIVIVLER